MFQFTRPRGARQDAGDAFRCVDGFNSHARVGRDFIEFVICEHNLSFNSHARVGRDNDINSKQHLSTVSIHTPAWGATNGPTTRQRF